MNNFKIQTSGKYSAHDYLKGYAKGTS